MALDCGYVCDPGGAEFLPYEKALLCQPKSLVLGFDCVPLFSSREGVSKRARVQSRSSDCEPKGNLGGFLARLHASPQNEGQAARQNDQVCRGGRCHDVEQPKVGSSRITIQPEIRNFVIAEGVPRACACSCYLLLHAFARVLP